LFLSLVCPIFVFPIYVACLGYLISDDILSRVSDTATMQYLKTNRWLSELINPRFVSSD
jgi:hypothetical protein